MRFQVVSDLHLESQEVAPIAPAPDAEGLLLVGDIDTRWHGLARFAGWPVPVWLVAGNHEFDGRDVVHDLSALRDEAARHGIRLLERESLRLQGRDGRRIRVVATVRWCDFDSLGADRRDKAMRAAGWHLDRMAARFDGQPLDASRLRDHALDCRAWLEAALRDEAEAAQADATLVLTHYAPSLRSADPRYGLQPTTASFCNADDDLLPLADVWIHGHLHFRGDWRDATGGGRCRVICNAMGLTRKGEAEGFDPAFCVDV